MPRHKVPASLLSCSLLGLERLTAAGALGCCEAVVRTHRGHLEDSSTGFETKEMVEASASKWSIRRFVITDMAPTRAFSWLKVATTAFNQEKVLVGAFSVITNLRMELFEALISTCCVCCCRCGC